MNQNCRDSPDHSEFTTSESDVVAIDEVLPDFNKKRIQCRTLSKLPAKSSKRNHEESDESSSDHQSFGKLFKIDCRRRKMNIKRRSEETNNLFLNEGFYSCEVCDAYFRSYKGYESHLNDKSHLKAFRKIKAKIQSVNKRTSPKLNGHASGYVVSNEKGSNYPAAPFGVIRRKVLDESVIQDVVEKKLSACPGLEHVTEIRGLKETFYYCAICNLTCGREKILSHLKKPKHLLYSLKAISPREYLNLQFIPKSERKYHLYSLLYSHQEKEGIGRIIVEKDYLDDYDTKKKRCSYNLEALSTSSHKQSVLYNKGYTYPRNDYFCFKCECSMFDADIWTSHRNRKWDQKWVRKTSVASYLRVTCMSKSDAFLIDRFTDVDFPVGLDFICEFQHFDDKKETYHCFICGDCLSCLEIVQHVTSLSHRIKYIEHIDHYSIDKVRSLDPYVNKTYYILGEICRRIQTEIGSGCPKVYLIKKND